MIPVLAGFPWLASILSAIVLSFLSFFVRIFTKKMAFVAFFVSASALFTSAFFSALESLVSTISLSVPDYFNVACQMIVPSNSTACISVMISARVLRFIYDWNIKILNMKFS